ncbi:hypothetical protein RFI02_02005 [Acinetobacter sichuanensis]|uniref:helix-turn-helix transcriptional regulator n=1 Tax=Acinetobacter sichuanensis TaxID=2136183 RepID=UPI00280E94DC|nr:hypothetical protein [Acinetobacter sichuanensis]MDQ9019873.1 hypothetical protein [Acinetobacter sichuanensis]
MKAEKEHDLLQAIFNEMQALKKAIVTQDERRVNSKEFAERLGLSESTLWSRINDGLIVRPLKDGRLSFWLNSYVNEIVTNPLNSDKVAA